MPPPFLRAVMGESPLAKGIGISTSLIVSILNDGLCLNAFRIASAPASNHPTSSKIDLNEPSPI